MREFFTRSAANEGIQVPLWLPDGSASAHWIRIRGVDSDAFRAAEARWNRELSRIAALGADEQAAEMERARLDLLTALVVGWSFEQEASEENIREFLIEAPQIADAINKTAGQRALFLSSSSANSSNTPPALSNSTKRRKDQSRPSASA
jgi:hypothetical protein